MNIKTSEEKIKEIEARLKALEEKIFSPQEVQEQKLMDALFERAKALVIKEKEVDHLFVGRKLVIDFQRVTRILDRLEKEGVVGPEVAGTRKVLVSKI